MLIKIKNGNIKPKDSPYFPHNFLKGSKALNLIKVTKGLFVNNQKKKKHKRPQNWKKNKCRVITNFLKENNVRVFHILSPYLRRSQNIETIEIKHN